MPAASEPGAGQVVPLPQRFRPFGVRIAASALGIMLLTTCVVIWFAFPPEIRDQFTWLQRGTLVVFGLAVGAAGHALARSRVEARPDGLTVVNGYRSHRYHWHEVLSVSLRAGSPWASLDLSDGTTASVMGIQGSDGARATAQVRLLRRLINQQSSTERND